MKKFKKILMSIYQDESGQGATEYILMLVVVVALVMAFREPILTIIGKKTNEIGGKMDNVFAK